MLRKKRGLRDEGGLRGLDERASRVRDNRAPCANLLRAVRRRPAREVLREGRRRSEAPRRSASRSARKSTCPAPKTIGQAKGSKVYPTRSVPNRGRSRKTTRSAGTRAEWRRAQR